jgi:cytoskeletal protein CcmA (bactofilin family)
MFTSSKIIPDTVTNKSNKIDTIIGALTTIQGNMSGSGTIRVDGKYNGDICTETDVIIGETGSVTGNITSANVTISGIVEGNMKCSELLEILPTGQLIGDIEAKNISINTGAIFKGKCAMNTKETTIQEVNENIQETISQ